MFAATCINSCGNTNMLPFCLVDYILKFAGAYALDTERRPYIPELHRVREILPAQGVRAAALHLKEYHALQRAYRDYPVNPLRGLYEDALHLL